MMRDIAPIVASLVRQTPTMVVPGLVAATMLLTTTIGTAAIGQEGRSTAQVTVVEPRTGSAERTAILDAVRSAVHVESRFRVHHLRSTGQWAFFHGTEVVELDEKELQETDLDVAALLTRRGTGASARWTVVELWTLPTEEKQPRARFFQQVHARQKALRLPAALFPPDF
jgi:hypothetical protein